jgi:hypothetical protein
LSGPKGCFDYLTSEFAVIALVRVEVASDFPRRVLWINFARGEADPGHEETFGEGASGGCRHCLGDLIIFEDGVVRFGLEGVLLPDQLLDHCAGLSGDSREGVEASNHFFACIDAMFALCANMIVQFAGALSAAGKAGATPAFGDGVEVFHYHFKFAHDEASFLCGGVGLEVGRLDDLRRESLTSMRLQAAAVLLLPVSRIV